MSESKPLADALHREFSEQFRELVAVLVRAALKYAKKQPSSSWRQLAIAPATKTGKRKGEK
jgi:hypothetical protein